MGGRVSTLFRTWARGHVGVVKSGKWEERLEIILSKFVMINNYIDNSFDHKYPLQSVFFSMKRNFGVGILASVEFLPTVIFNC